MALLRVALGGQSAPDRSLLSWHFPHARCLLQYRVWDDPRSRTRSHPVQDVDEADSSDPTNSSDPGRPSRRQRRQRTARCALAHLFVSTATLHHLGNRSHRRLPASQTRSRLRVSSSRAPKCLRVTIGCLRCSSVCPCASDRTPWTALVQQQLRMIEKICNQPKLDDHSRCTVAMALLMARNEPMVGRCHPQLLLNKGGPRCPVRSTRANRGAP